jgi:plasmid stability protein
MAALLIKDLPPRLHRKLKIRAEANRRSVTQEVITLLEQALEDRAGPPQIEAVDALRIRGRRPLTQDLLDRARSTGRP